ASVVRHIDVESGVHLRIGVIRRRVFYHRDLVAELSGKSNGRFDAGMCDESDDDELVDAVVLELQIQVRVGEAAGNQCSVATISPGLGSNSGRISHPTCRIRSSFAPTTPSESAQCTSKSRSRPGGIDDATRRRREAPPYARH